MPISGPRVAIIIMIFRKISFSDSNEKISHRLGYLLYYYYILGSICIY